MGCYRFRSENTAATEAEMSPAATHSPQNADKATLAQNVLNRNNTLKSADKATRTRIGTNSDTKLKSADAASMAENVAPATTRRIPLTQ